MSMSRFSVEVIICDIESKFPEFLRATDLISSGLFKSRSDVSYAMIRNQAPPCIRLSSHKIIFPRALLCEWLKEKAGESLIKGEN